MPTQKSKDYNRQEKYISNNKTRKNDKKMYLQWAFEMRKGVNLQRCKMG